MFWSLTGNKWLDKQIKNLCNFYGEMGSPACEYSPLTNKDISLIKKELDKLCEILNAVAERTKRK